MTSAPPSGHNLGELMRAGVTLTTQEALAVAHEVCRDATVVFPDTPDALWLTDTGEVLIARSDQIVAPVNPRDGVASLLEAMLPADGALAKGSIVAPALRGLPGRLRATTEDVGPRHRQDLMAILSWHLDADSREVTRQLAARLGSRDEEIVAPTHEAHPEPAQEAHPQQDTIPEEYFDLPLSVEPARVVAAAVDETPTKGVDSAPTKSRGERKAATLAFAAAGFLFLAIGSVSYWSVRNTADEQGRAVTALPVNAAPSTPTVETPKTSPPPVRDGRVLRTQPLDLEVAGGAFSPAFANTGRELFFHSGRAAEGRLLVASVDDQGAVSAVNAVRTDAARNYHPRISPDGRWIAFDSDRDGDRGVYVAGRDGAQIQRVSGPGYGAVPSWSPDMKTLAFIRGEPQRPKVWNLWLRDLATGTLRRQTSFRSGQVWGASWFPDGRSLCYSHDEQLVISPLDGRPDIVIDSPRRGRLARTPAVSPDGRRVVFQVFRDGVWLLDVNTRAMRRILDDPTAEEFAWSPDGARIAYHSRRDGHWKIWLMSVGDG